MILDRISAAVAAFLDPMLVDNAREYRRFAEQLYTRDSMAICFGDYDMHDECYRLDLRQTTSRQEDRIRRAMGWKYEKLGARWPYDNRP